MVEGVTGLRPKMPVTEDPYVPVERPGWVGAVAAGTASAVAGWVSLSTLSSLAWLSAPVGSYPGVLRIATQLWLAGHGGGFVAEGTRWTLVPYGLTLLLGVLLAQVSVAVLRRLGGPGDLPTRARLLRGTLLVVTYALVVGLTGLLAGSPVQGAKAFGGALVVAVAAVCWARSRTTGTAGGLRWPRWSRQLARALGVGLSALVLVGTVALVTGLVVHRGRLVVLTEALGGGVAGGLGAVLAQVLYVPTFVVWATSYTVGAGFGLGDGSLVSPSDTHAGLLPGWPVSAALPAQGPGSLINLAWLAGAVVAGGLAAWVFLHRTIWRRPDTVMVFGGLVGLLLGLLATLLGLLTRGDLGVARLTDLGPRPLELLILSTLLTTTGGLLVGMVRGIVRWVRLRRAAAAQPVVSGTLVAGPGPATASTTGSAPTTVPPPYGEGAPATGTAGTATTTMTVRSTVSGAGDDGPRIDGTGEAGER